MIGANRITERCGWKKQTAGSFRLYRVAQNKVFHLFCRLQVTQLRKRKILQYLSWLLLLCGYYVIKSTVRVNVYGTSCCN